MLEEDSQKDHITLRREPAVINSLLNRALACLSVLSPEETAKELTFKKAGTPEQIFLAVKAAEILIRDF